MIWSLIMKNPLTIKFAAIFFITLLLLIPITLISNLIEEREWRHQEVKNDIANSSSRAQKIMGPLLLVRYWHIEKSDDKETKKLKTKFFLPHELTIDSDMKTFEKKRGIYSALLYRSLTQISGSIDTTLLTPYLNKHLDSVNLVVAVSDMRGIGVDTQARINNKLIDIKPGTLLSGLSEGIHISLTPTQLKEHTSIQFDLSMPLLGMESLDFVPIGNKSQISIIADWPHPSFKGKYLPLQSNIDASSFSAQWQTSYFTTNIAQLMSQCIYRAKCDELKSRSLGVNLIDPVDHYLKSHRSINYAFLMIVLAFACFFILEIIRKQPIHPIQYGFVGLALALFYLLLLSLSEHLGFNMAYGISASASTVLLTYYVASMLNNKIHTIVFATALSSLYALMFILLGAEDYALLLGSLLIFSVLSLIMLMTKNLDWYSNQTTVIND